MDILRIIGTNSRQIRVALGLLFREYSHGLPFPSLLSLLGHWFVHNALVGEVHVVMKGLGEGVHKDRAGLSGVIGLLCGIQ